MREIKFRGKRIDNGEWVYGYYWTNEIGNHFIKAIKSKDDNFVSNPTTNDFEVNPETVGQYTGLEDKNGTKIFEGDITNHHSHKTTVSWKWSENYNQICGVEADGTHRFYFSIDSVNLEIIGNIHDNPELVEEELK